MDKLIRQSILAGMLVGIGVVIHVTASNKVIGAMLFSFALLTIIKCNLKLYTGKIGFYQSETASNLLCMLIFNLVGVLIPTFGVSVCRQSLREAIVKTSEVKFAGGIPEIFLYGLLCGVLMFLAVYAKDTVITIFAIMIFILSGYEHCIADFIYLALNFSPGNFVKFLFIILGNSVGSIAACFLICEKN